jgi:hypothetical protein
MMRDTREDTIIKVLDKASGRQRDQLIRKGTLMLVDLVGISTSSAYLSAAIDSPGVRDRL